MKLLLSAFVLASLAGCQASMAAKDCETIGYAAGSPEFTQCAERQLAKRQNLIKDHLRQQNEIRLQCEKSSQGIFGRNTGRTDCR